MGAKAGQRGVAEDVEARGSEHLEVQVHRELPVAAAPDHRLCEADQRVLRLKARVVGGPFADGADGYQRRWIACPGQKPRGGCADTGVIVAREFLGERHAFSVAQVRQ